MRHARQAERANEEQASRRREAEAASEELRRLLDVAYQKSLALLRSFPEKCRHKHRQVEDQLQSVGSILPTDATPADVAVALIEAAAQADKGLGPGSLDALPTEGTPRTAYFRPLHFLGELFTLARRRRKAELEEALQRLRRTRPLQEFVLWFGPVAAALCGVQREFGVHPVPIEVPVPLGISSARGPEFAEVAFRAVGMRSTGKRARTTSPDAPSAPAGRSNSQPGRSSSVNTLVRHRLAIADALDAFYLLCGHIWTHLSVRSQHFYGVTLPESYAMGAEVPRTIKEAVVSFQKSVRRLREFEPVAADFVWLRCGDQKVTSRSGAPDLGRWFASATERTTNEWQKQVIQPFQAAVARGREWLEESCARFDLERDRAVAKSSNRLATKVSIGNAIRESLESRVARRQEALQDTRKGVWQLLSRAAANYRPTAPEAEWQEQFVDFLVRVGTEMGGLGWDEWFRSTGGEETTLQELADLILAGHTERIAEAVRELANSRPESDVVTNWLKSLPQRWSDDFHGGWLLWKLGLEFPPKVASPVGSLTNATSPGGPGEEDAVGISTPAGAAIGGRALGPASSTSTSHAPGLARRRKKERLHKHIAIAVREGKRSPEEIQTFVAMIDSSLVHNGSSKINPKYMVNRFKKDLKYAAEANLLQSI
jgi:hypothetical protein